MVDGSRTPARAHVHGCSALGALPRRRGATRGRARRLGARRCQRIDAVAETVSRLPDWRRRVKLNPLARVVTAVLLGTGCRDASEGDTGAADGALDAGDSSMLDAVELDASQDASALSCEHAAVLFDDFVTTHWRVLADPSSQVRTGSARCTRSPPARCRLFARRSGRTARPGLQPCSSDA